jgi:DNA-directed RNA polymerase subunit L
MYVKSCAVTFSLYDIKYPYFVNLSITIKIESYLILIPNLTEAGNLIIKSIATFYHAPVSAVFTFNFP